jgi:hypothetical protein
MIGLPWVEDDGGRAAAGFVGQTGDCVVRAIAIAAQLPYARAYDDLRHDMRNNASLRRRLERAYGQHAHQHLTPRRGVPRDVYDPYLAALGYAWTPTMHVGSGCQVHLAPGELPDGRLVVRVSKHICAVIDGVVHDLADPCRDGTRCVYGYWQPSS